MFRYENDKPQKEGFPAQTPERAPAPYRTWPKRISFHNKGVPGNKMRDAMAKAMRESHILSYEIWAPRFVDEIADYALRHDDTVDALSFAIEGVRMATSDLRPAPWYHRLFNWLRSCFPGAAKNIVE